MGTDSHMMPGHSTESLLGCRLCMVLSSLAPLFVLWAIRGSCVIPDYVLVPVCIGFTLVPTLVLCWRIRTAERERDTSRIVIGSCEDRRAHVLTYLFAMLLPFYRTGIESFRDVAATVAALAFIVFLFLHLRMHYTNILFALRGYHVFTVTPPQSNNPHDWLAPLVLITPRQYLVPGESVVALRLSDTIYLEKRDPSDRHRRNRRG